MPKQIYRLKFEEMPADTEGPVSKLGGKPHWLTEPEWPLTRQYGLPMRFLGQLKIPPDLFGMPNERLAYIFRMSPPDFRELKMPGPFEEELALVIQPGEFSAPKAPMTGGPTIFREEKGEKRRFFFFRENVQVPCHYRVDFIPAEEPDPPGNPDRDAWSPLWDVYCEAIGVNKIGGAPSWVQDEEEPAAEGGPWRFLFQIDNDELPHIFRFGDIYSIYGFLSEDGRRGSLISQFT